MALLDRPSPQSERQLQPTGAARPGRGRAFAALGADASGGFPGIHGAGRDRLPGSGSRRSRSLRGLEAAGPPAAEST